MSTNKIVLAVVGGLVVLVAGITALVVFLGGGTTDDVEAPPETRPVAISGARLPQGSTSTPDPAAGMLVPTVTGSDFDGDTVTIAPDDGRPKLLLFVAHWCPHCQEEAPEVQQWVNGGNLPEAVDLIAISTSVSRVRDNYPPSTWLASVGWNSPVLVDDDESSVAQAFGLEAFPYWVFVDGEGRVVGRAAGRLPMDTIDAVARGLATP